MLIGTVPCVHSKVQLMNKTFAAEWAYTSAYPGNACACAVP
jgi:hypothetical protein